MNLTKQVEYTRAVYDLLYRIVNNCKEQCDDDDEGEKDCELIL